MPSLEVPAVLLFPQEGLGFVLVLIGVSPPCSSTCPQLSSAERVSMLPTARAPGTSLSHLCGSPGLNTWEVPWIPFQVNLHQQVQQRTVLNRAWSPCLGDVLFQNDFGARPGNEGGTKAYGAGKIPAGDRFRWQQPPQSGISELGRCFPEPFGWLLGAISNLSKHEASTTSHFSMTGIHPGHRHVSAATPQDGQGATWQAGKPKCRQSPLLGLKLYPCIMFPVAILFFKKLLILSP